MRQLVLAISICVWPFAPALADEAKPEDQMPLLEGLDELADSMRQLFEGFQEDVSPMMEGLADQLRGLNNYHAPEVLPNGDIIIRRKSPAEVAPDTSPDEDGAIDI